MKMKKNCIAIAAMAMVCVGTQAQYKKASFLNKAGRTYDLGASAHLLGSGRNLMPGLYASWGRDQGKRIFHWFDLEVLLPTNFKYNTIGDYDSTVTVSVKGRFNVGLAYRYNFACYFFNAEKVELKLKPFITAGLNIIITGAASASKYTYTPEVYYPKVTPASANTSIGANIGLGGIYELSETKGIKVTVGYNFQSNEEDHNYEIYKNHPYITAGIRFLMKDE